MGSTCLGVSNGTTAGSSPFAGGRLARDAIVGCWGEGRVCESWRVKMGDGTLRDICHHGNSWYVVHDMDDDRPDDGWSP